MNITELSALQATSQILQEQVAPALDSIVCEQHGKLRYRHQREVQRLLNIVEELIYQLDNDED